MVKASEYLLERTIKLLWKNGYTEEEIMTLLHISRAKVKILRAVKRIRCERNECESGKLKRQERKRNEPR